MPIALTIAPDPPVPPIPPRRRWTRAECSALESSGIWEQQNVELIDGELISKMGKNRPHVNALLNMMLWLMDAFGRDRVNPETPIDVAPEDNPTNEPQPDLIVLKRPSSTFQSRPPQPSELALVVEVADTTLQFDLTVKARLYARAGIVEYWVVDVTGRRLIVHRDPAPVGYRSVAAYSESEKVTPHTSPQSELLVGDILPN
ncbi:MAG TPA: Uma2 family endonuclease [Candidatus Acidoferrales bacterium]|jgi:Uma2 family endonuclease|nr:Uma2 family endonuclease [Candidatus Acidoferrales bacterium]